MGILDRHDPGEERVIRDRDWLADSVMTERAVKEIGVLPQ
jgi:hypothetical protein